jgi:hypothetical protein
MDMAPTIGPLGHIGPIRPSDLEKGRIGDRYIWRGRLGKLEAAGAMSTWSRGTCSVTCSCHTLIDIECMPPRSLPRRRGNDRGIAGSEDAGVVPEGERRESKGEGEEIRK